MGASFFIRKINKFLATQGKALPREAEDVLKKAPSQLTERESQWYKENLKPHESFFVETFKTLYSRERKPEGWLKEIGSEASMSIVEEIVVKALGELGVPIHHYAEENPGIFTAGNVSPTAETQLGRADEERIECGAVPPSEGKAPTASPTESELPEPTELSSMPAAGPVTESESFSVDMNTGEMVGTFHLQQDKPDYRREEGPGELIHDDGEYVPESPQAGRGDGFEGKITPAIPTIYLPETPALIDYRQIRERTMESRFSPPVVDHRYELERGPGVSVDHGLEVTLPERAAPGAVPQQKGVFGEWLSRRKALVFSMAVALALVGTGIYFLFFFLPGREKVIDEWSVSQSLGRYIRVERRACLKKNADDSPFLYAVTLKLENTSGEEIKKVLIEEEVPQLLWARGGIKSTPDPERSSEEYRRMGWTAEHINVGDNFQIEYRLPLQAELSAPQLDEIKEHFNRSMIACVYLPENFETCQACNGQGNSPCQACSGMSTVTCPTCRGVGYLNCSVCRGQGMVNCSICSGKGYYILGLSIYPCYYCSFTGKVTCRNCRGTGRAICPSCRGAMRSTCASCGGMGKITCSNCSGHGRLPIQYGERVLYNE